MTTPIASHAAAAFANDGMQILPPAVPRRPGCVTRSSIVSPVSIARS
jgi:hypothetical protein